MKSEYSYKIVEIKKPIVIDGNLEKESWKKIQAIEIKNFIGQIPNFHPKVKVKSAYDKSNIYLIFSVFEPNIKCVQTQINSAVYEDSCVEFFFAPDLNFPNRYFNLEINCGGTALMRYYTIPRNEFTEIKISEIEKIEIAHSLPKVIENEILEPTIWTIECKIPFEILKNYCDFTIPKTGAKWKVNLYKVAPKSTNPHYISWSKIDRIKPDFHLPEFFGVLIFK